MGRRASPVGGDAALMAGFLPDSISTDLHVDSMNAGMKDMLNIGDKFLAIGWPMKEVIAAMTWHPAHEVQQDQLGNSPKVRLRMLR